MTPVWYHKANLWCVCVCLYVSSRTYLPGKSDFKMCVKHRWTIPNTTHRYPTKKASYWYPNPYCLSWSSIIKWPQSDTINQIFDVYVYVFMWLQGHIRQAEVTLKCVGNIDGPFQIPCIDIQLRRFLLRPESILPIMV